MAREIIHAGLANEAFIRRATTGFEAYAASRRAVHAGARRARHRRAGRGRSGEAGARLRPRRPGADLLDPRHHRAPQRGRQRARADQPGPAHRPRRPVRLGREPAARPEQRAGRRRHGRHPQPAGRLPGRRDRPGRRGPSSSAAWGVPMPPETGWHLSPDVRGDGARRAHRALRHRREPAAVGGGPAPDRASCSTGSTISWCRTSSSPTPPSSPHVVLPATASWCEAEGTVTNSERRVQRVRKALEPPGERARRHRDHLRDRPAARVATWGHPTAEDLWNEVRALAPMHAGMSYARLEELGGIQWPCSDESTRASCSCTPGSGRTRSRARPRRSPSWSTTRRSSVPDEEYPAPADHRAPAGLLQHRRADRPVHLAAAAGRDARPLPRGRRRLGLAEGELVRVSSRRGSRGGAGAHRRVAPAGLVFMTLHFPDEVETNMLTLDATDPKSGTAEFKATAVRVEPMRAAEPRAPTAARPIARSEALVDLRLTERRTDDDERAAVDACSAPRPPAGTAASARRPTGPCRVRRARRAGPAASAAAGAARGAGPGRLDQRGRARTTSAQRLTVPPAEAYGVATFYALFSTAPRPRRVVHVCDDIACRCNGAEQLCDELERRSGRPITTGPREIATRSAPTARSGTAAPASACATGAGGAAQRAGDAARGAALRRRPGGAAWPRRSRRISRPPPSPARALPQAGDPFAAAAAPGRTSSTRRASTPTGPPAGTRRCAGPSSWARRA